MLYYKHPPMPFVGNWQGRTFPPNYVHNDALGGVLTSKLESGMLKWAIVGAAAYHGFKRYGSKPVALGYAIGALLDPLVAGAVVGYQAYKDGFAKPKR